MTDADTEAGRGEGRNLGNRMSVSRKVEIMARIAEQVENPYKNLASHIFTHGDVLDLRDLLRQSDPAAPTDEAPEGEPKYTRLVEGDVGGDIDWPEAPDPMEEVRGDASPPVEEGEQGEDEHPVEGCNCRSCNPRGYYRGGTDD